MEVIGHSTLEMMSEVPRPYLSSRKLRAGQMSPESKGFGGGAPVRQRGHNKETFPGKRCRTA